MYEAIVSALIVLILVTVLLYICVILPIKYMALDDVVNEKRKDDVHNRS